MTDADGRAPAPAARGSTLGLRLALAFLSVALAAVALLAGLTAALAAAVSYTHLTLPTTERV